MIVPGVFGILLCPGPDNPNRVRPTLATDLSTVVLRCLILTALNAVSTLACIDSVQVVYSETGDDVLVKVGRGVTPSAMVVESSACLQFNTPRITPSGSRGSVVPRAF